MIRSLGRELLHALRIYAKTPAQSALAIGVMGISLALAIGFFRLYGDLAFQAQPGMKEPDRLVSLGLSEGGATSQLRWKVVEALMEDSRTLGLVAGSLWAQGELRNSRGSRSLQVALVTREYFGLGVRMKAGRGLAAGGFVQGSEPTAVISSALAADLFGQADGAVGKLINIEGVDWRVVGVAAPEFQGLRRGQSQDVWVAMPVWMDRVHRVTQRLVDLMPVESAARLSKGVQIQAARDEVKEITRGWPLDLKRLLNGQRIAVHQEMASDPAAYRRSKGQALLLVTLASLLTLVSSGNLGFFLLARMPKRRREFAIRMVVGATTWRLRWQVLAEASAMALVAGLLGVAAAVAIQPWLAALPLFSETQFLFEPGFAWQSMAFVFMLALLVACSASLAPLVALDRDFLSEGVHARPVHNISRQAIATAQVSLGLAVLSAALFSYHALKQASDQFPGVKAEGITIASLEVSGQARMADGSTDVLALAESIESRLKNLEGVKLIGFADFLPGLDAERYVAIADGPSGRHETNAVPMAWNRAAVDVLAPRFLKGRLPEAGDSDFLLVSESLASEFWRGKSPVGRILYVDGQPAPVTGVINDIQTTRPGVSRRPVIITGGLQSALKLNVIIDGGLSRQAVRSELQAHLRSHSSGWRIDEVVSMNDAIHSLFSRDISRNRVIGLAAICVVLLSLFGFYGTLRYLFDSRRHELAIRLAVGADSRRLYAHVFGAGMQLTIPGLVLGVLSAWILTAWMQQSLGMNQASAMPPVLVALIGFLALLAFCLHTAAAQTIGGNLAEMLKDE